MSDNQTLVFARTNAGMVHLGLCTHRSGISHDITADQAYDLARQLVAAADKATGKPYPEEVGFVRWFRGMPDEPHDGLLLSTVLIATGERSTELDEVVETTLPTGLYYSGFSNSDAANTVAWAFLPDPASTISDPIEGVDYAIDDEEE